MDENRVTDGGCDDDGLRSSDQVRTRVNFSSLQTCVRRFYRVYPYLMLFIVQSLVWWLTRERGYTFGITIVVFIFWLVWFSSRLIRRAAMFLRSLL